MAGGAAAGSAAAVAAKEAARVESDALRERQLQAYVAFSRYVKLIPLSTVTRPVLVLQLNHSNTTGVQQQRYTVRSKFRIVY